MGMGGYIAIIGVTCIVAALIGFLLAKFKQRNADFWTFLSFIFPPAVILLAFLPRPSQPYDPNAERQSRAADAWADD